METTIHPANRDAVVTGLGLSVAKIPKAANPAVLRGMPPARADGTMFQVSEVSFNDKPAERLDIPGTRGILSTMGEFRTAAAEIATHATRSLSIYTPNLEPDLYDHDQLLEPIKKLVLARSYARIRVLISDPARSRRENRFMQMALRLTTFIELRNVHIEHRGNPCAFVVADDKAIAYRPDWAKWQGIVEFDDTSVVRRHLNHFNEVWAVSMFQPEMRSAAVEF
jgi:hypothetical protein